MSDFHVLLVTPPFTQLNTPYPATAYLKGFLNASGIASTQSDLGIEVILALFTPQKLEELFAHFPVDATHSAQAHFVFDRRRDYIRLIPGIVHFLQGKDETLAYPFSHKNTFPCGQRFRDTEIQSELFGIAGIQDKAKYYCTLVLEDFSDYLQEVVDPHFGFSRYAERIARCASSFETIYHELEQETRFIEEIMLQGFDALIQQTNPKLIAITAPFPGNVFASFRCAQFVKQKYPSIAIAFGGGFANTELREVSDPRVFEFMDFICLDDGEIPLLHITEYLQKRRPIELLKRTFICRDGIVEFINGSIQQDLKQDRYGNPDTTGLPLPDYISVLEISNPMHRLWNDGRWNKLTMAHGCYWGKCTFCDISLPYIRDYEPIAAALICDRMEYLMQQTQQSGFHFVDEAAPPALMKEVALEIIRRRLVVTWWTNIRFEKAFTRDLCILLRESGCVAVSGGLEVASDRLLALIKKGVSLEQVTHVTKNFRSAGILVHAYLMYGYPTQTTQETIDSLEVVKQLFEQDLLQSAFWHQFALTVHSPIASEPERYGIQILQTTKGTFANNDLEFKDLTGIDHNAFSFGLKKSMYNYMHGLGFEKEVHTWFDKSDFKLKIPRTGVAPNFIASIVQQDQLPSVKPNLRVVWLGQVLRAERITKSRKGNSWEELQLILALKDTDQTIHIPAQQGEWLLHWLNQASLDHPPVTLGQLQSDFERNNLGDFELFWCNKPMNLAYKWGVLVV